MGLLIIFACLIATKLAYFIVQKWIRNLPSLRIILHRASLIFQNFFVGSFAESLDPLIFYSTMEFRNPEEEYYVTSLLVYVLSILFGSAFLLFSFRSVIESLIVGLFFKYPLTQAILLVTLTFLLLAYIIIKKPFKKQTLPCPTIGPDPFSFYLQPLSCFNGWNRYYLQEFLKC